MKIWEKVNNITGNATKARYLVEYINAGAKFILSALPEKFLWTVATETDINGWDKDDVDNSNIGAGSEISYDKILAVYRYDSGKKRVCAESPDNSIHIFDEEDSLLRATEMFPKFYKLGGKIFIKPDPDYNATDEERSYTPLGGIETQIFEDTGDKGVIVYSAPPIIDENNETWILTEYENIAIFYAGSLDFLRLSSEYRDLCKAQVDAAVGSLLTSYRSSIPDYDPTIATDGSTSVKVPSKVLSFSVSEALPTFVFDEDLPNDFDISSSLPSGISMSESLPSYDFSDVLISSVGEFLIDEDLPTFVFGESLPTSIDVSSVSLPEEMSMSVPLPSQINITTALPSDIDMSLFDDSTFVGKFDTTLDTSLPSGIAVASTLPSDFATSQTLPSSLSLDIDLPASFSLSAPSFNSFSSPTLPDDMSADSHAFVSSQMDDALAKAENMVDGSTMGGDSSDAESVQYWLKDEDTEMAQSTLGAARQEIERAQQEISKEKVRLDSFNGKVGEKVQRFNGSIAKYKVEVDKEAQRVNTEIGKYTKELDKETQRVSTGLAKYGGEISKEAKRLESEIQKYTTEVQKESNRITTGLSKYQNELQKESQRVNSQLATYEKEIQKESSRIQSDLSRRREELEEQSNAATSKLTKYQAELSKESQRYESQVQAYQSEIQKEAQRVGIDISKYNALLGKESARVQSELANYQAALQKSINSFSSGLQKYQSEVQKESARVNADVAKFQASVSREVQRFQGELGKYQGELGKESARVNSEVSKYQSEVQKESTRVNSKLGKYNAGLQKSSQEFTLDLNKYQADVQKSSADLQKDVQQFTLDIQNYAGLIGAKGNKFQLDMATSKSYLEEAGTKLQAAGIYAQKSGASIATSRDYYQRALGELSAITGANTAPEQQQVAQRREQGAAT